MKLGLSLGYQTAWSTPADHLALAQEAERLGFSVVWAAEAYGSDAPTMLSWIAGQTSTIDVGTAIMQIPARTPAMTAMTAATIDTLVRRPVPARARASPVRRSPRAGTGCGSPSRCSGPGSTWRSSGRRWPARPSSYQGEFYTLPLPDGPGKALKLELPPAARVGARSTWPRSGRSNLELAGEIADGWLAVFSRPEFAGELLASIAAGRAKAGKTLDGFDVVPTRRRSWSATTSRPAPTLVRWYAALYVGGMGSREQNFYNQLAVRMGYGDAAREVQDLYLAKRQRDAAAAVPLEFIDRTALLGPVDRIAERLRGYADAGRHHPVGEPVRRRPGRAACSTLRTVRRGATTASGAGGVTRMEYWQASSSASSRASPSSCPVSSTGHLTITEKLLDLQIDDPGVTAFTAIIQVGAILAAIIYFWRDIVRIVVGVRARPVQRAGPGRRRTGGCAGGRSSARSRSRSSAWPRRTSSRTDCAACGWWRSR